MAWWRLVDQRCYNMIVKGKPKQQAVKLTNAESVAFFEEGVIQFLRNQRGREDERLCDTTGISEIGNYC